MSIALSSIRQCLDGGTPSVIATCSADGAPNVSYVSEVHFVDSNHVALSYQFFNKTRENVLANSTAEALVIDTANGNQFRLGLRYLRTETDGAIFESMRVKLAGIAAHTGMSSVFRLRGADIYRVEAVEAVGDDAPAALAVPANLLPVLRRCSNSVAECHDLESLLGALLSALETELSILHSSVFLHDESGRRLYLIASNGYVDSGIGSEIPLGYGIVGISAIERTPIRITHMAEEFRYGSAIRDSAIDSGIDTAIETAIPLPGLERPGSQLAVPVIAGDQLFGVLYVESVQDGAFGYDAEDILVTIANQFATALILLDQNRTETVAPGPAAIDGKSRQHPLRIRFYDSNCSVFLGDEYLIKGVAGSIFWKLVREYNTTGRREFSNREIRLDPEIGLPEINENLEARLVLLKHRLRERGGDIAIVPVARGKFRLDVSRPLLLEAADA